MSETVPSDPGERLGRARWFTPESLDADQRELYDAILSGPRSSAVRATSLTDERGRLRGPFNAMFYSPLIGKPLQELGAAIRYRSGLDGAARELAILEVARVTRCDTEWHGHSRVAESNGVTTEQLETLRHGGMPEGLTPVAESVLGLARVLLAEGDLDDEQFAHYTSVLGEVALMEVIALVGYYCLLALSLRVWRIPLVEGQEPVFEH